MDKIIIQCVLKEIERLAKEMDNEEAHRRQDILVKNFIEMVSGNNTLSTIELKELAVEIKKVYDINYIRWYA